MVTFDEIVSAIRELPLPERLRVAEHVIHEAAREVPASSAADAPDNEEPAELIEVAGLLVVKADRTFPADTFDHRPVREERLSKLSGRQ